MVIYGFDYPNQSVDTLIEAFETLADRRVVLGPLNEVELGPLVHPVHAAGRVLAPDQVPTRCCSRGGWGAAVGTEAPSRGSRRIGDG